MNLKSRIILLFLVIFIHTNLAADYILADEAGIISNPLYISENVESNDFDIVFAIDNSSNMYRYDMGIDDGWIDSLCGLMEQASDNSSFAVVTKEKTGAFGNIAAITEQLHNITRYSGQVSASDLLQNAASALVNSTKRKMVVFSVASCYNYDELFDEIKILNNQGIAVYVIAFEKDEGKGDMLRSSHDNVIVCKDAKELSVLIGDLNAYLVEFKSADLSAGQNYSLQSSIADTSVYESSFREGKHDYKLAVTDNQKAYYVAMLLNMYYLLPSIVYESDNYQYTYRLDGNQALQAGKGNNFELFGSYSEIPTGFEEFWSKKADSLLTSPNYSTVSTGINTTAKNIISENLKRKFPVIICEGETAGLLTAYSENGTVWVYDIGARQTSAKQISYYNGKNVKILNTQKYFNDIFSTAPVQNEWYISDGIVRLTVPGRNTETDFSAYKYDISNEKELSETMLSFDENTSKITIAAGYDGEFVVSISVHFDKNSVLPNRHNSTLKMCIRDRL